MGGNALAGKELVLGIRLSTLPGYKRDVESVHPNDYLQKSWTVYPTVYLVWVLIWQAS